MAENTEEEHLDSPTNTHSDNPSDEIIPSSDTKVINLNQETENMEVHHHAHNPAEPHHKKNWKSYFWEFLMLFLAVFCGFIAEYQLEHLVEHNREKQFIEFMVHDLIEDTAKIRIGINRNTLKTAGIDSLIRNILTTPYTDSSLNEMYQLTNSLHYRAEVVFTKRTITQLKNSGGLRLIRNLEASDSIVSYDEQCERIEKQFDILYWHQLKARDFEFKIFDPRYISGKKQKCKLLDNDEKLMMEFVSWLGMTKLGHTVYLTRLNEQLDRAARTIESLKKEYHLKN